MQEKEIRWKTSLLPFFIYLCFFIFVTSCDNGTITSIPELPDDSSDLTPGDISDRLIARIYFDATLSMQGFVVPGSTHYTQICPYLESVIVSGWKDGKADFFRFGERVETIDRDTYLRVRHADFYEDENIYRETFIQKIIDHEGQLIGYGVEVSSMPEESTELEISNMSEESIEITTAAEKGNEKKEENPLVVIVTDLFQDNSDINLLVTQLKEKYIQNGLEIGLFGLRSQFDGTVYDIGIGQEPLPYKSDPKDPETFRPFYILVLGRHADIAHYFDLLTAKGFSEAQTVIFSQYLVASLVSFEEESINWDNLNEDTFIRSQDSRLTYQFKIVNASNSAKISAMPEYDPSPHTMTFDSNALEASIIAKQLREGQIEDNLTARKCLEVKSKLLKDELSIKFAVDFNLTPQALPSERAIYLYEVSVSPKINGYRPPDWCSVWDMGTGRDGSKTLNLVNFVQDLSQVTAHTHRPKIAKFYFCIKK